MKNIKIYLLFLLCDLFGEFQSSDPKKLCPYTTYNIGRVYRHCWTRLRSKVFKIDLTHIGSTGLVSELTNAFLGYCSYVEDINVCVMRKLKSRDCDQILFLKYQSWASKSNTVCGQNGDLGDEIKELFRFNSSVDMDDVNRCKPSEFDFKTCKRLEDGVKKSIAGNNNQEISHRETVSLLDQSLCVYRSVFAACPTNTAAILTLLYKFGEWVPPRLGANMSRILRSFVDQMIKLN